MTITLHGLPFSNYYNKVKMALLEKGVPFEEAHAPTRSADPAHRAASPLGKVPFLTTPQGTLCESQVIVDWIEAAFPQPPLLPADPFEAAKVREITTFIDWHLEMAARQLYGQAFFGAPPLSESNLARIRRQVQEAVAGFRQLARFSPYVAGERFTQADLSASNSLPLVALATKVVFGEDLLAAGGIDHKAYLRLVGERPSAVRVAADRKAAQAK
jgi:glutathione S-transferase